MPRKRSRTARFRHSAHGRRAGRSDRTEHGGAAGRADETDESDVDATHAATVAVARRLCAAGNEQACETLERLCESGYDAACEAA
jgi:hypothetical protein